jgi:hypothetical protein
MNTYLKKIITATMAIAALALSAKAQPAPPPSPVGQWDCIVSGPGQNGIMFMNFTSDIDTNNGLPTFEAVFVNAGRQTIPTGRNGVPIAARAGSSSITNLFGGGFISGSAGPVANNGGTNDWMPDSRGHRGNWFFDSKGRVVGGFYTVVNATAAVTNFFPVCVETNLSIPLTNGSTFDVPIDICFSNAALSTNIAWGPAPDGETGTTNISIANTNFTLGVLGETNSVSFVGKVSGSHLTLTGVSTFGKLTIKGVPLVPVDTFFAAPDAFFWTGVLADNGVKSFETFTLMDTTIPNCYVPVGQGPSYTFGDGSLCLISSQKKMAFAIAEIPINSPEVPNGVSRATVGPLINTKKALGTKGVGDSTSGVNLIQFDANLSPYTFP